MMMRHENRGCWDFIWMRKAKSINFFSARFALSQQAKGITKWVFAAPFKC